MYYKKVQFGNEFDVVHGCSVEGCDSVQCLLSCAVVNEAKLVNSVMLSLL